MMKTLKSRTARILCGVRADAIFRNINKNKLLIIMYHGIFNKIELSSLPPFTHIHADTLCWQLEFLKNHYQVVSLAEVSRCLRERAPFPDRAVMISFDDGFKNNYDIAYPILRQFGMPAAVFLTVDYVGTHELLWFDALFLALRAVQRGDVLADSILPGLSSLCPADDLHGMYRIASTRFKQMESADRKKRISMLKEALDLSSDPLAEQFKLLSWEQVREMRASGLVEFGVHTATHRILSGLAADEYRQELVAPRVRLSRELNCEITSFCYPNGTPDIDFYQEHEEYLEHHGYVCAFSTHEVLNSKGCNRYRLGRLSVGSDMTSDRHVFRLRLAGLI
jgi:peptidoglycan/xylan/chitin deacetylase (PgdA/CDA1 family)